MKFRVIARLDIKKDNLIKGVHLEGLRVVGEPVERSLKYYHDGIDEILLVDSVASLYQRNNLTHIIESICRDIHIPVTVGGGIRSVNDAVKIFDAGADKIAVNTEAVKNPSLLTELRNHFGVQAVVLSVQAKSALNNSREWNVMTDNGRENTHHSVLEWIKEAYLFGFGEILLTSIDQEGTGSNYDLDLLKSVRSIVNVPILASGGFGHPSHALDCYKMGIDAAVIAGHLHYDKTSVNSLKSYLSSNNIPVRV